MCIQVYPWIEIERVEINAYYQRSQLLKAGDFLTNVAGAASGEIERTEQSWLSARWNGIRRPYSARDVWRLRGTVQPEHTFARLGAEKFERFLKDDRYIPALGALTGVQALQMVQAGLKSI